jgi:PhnB protein
LNAAKETIMATTVKPIPDGYHSLTPYLYVKGAVDAIEFYRSAFGAQELFRMPNPDGTVGHAEIKIGDSIVMLADESPQIGALSPQSLKGTSFSFVLYVEDVDATFKRAIAAGATEKRPLENKFYGDRTGMISDPFGHEWSISTHVEDVSPEEMDKRAAAEMAKMAGAPS